MNHLVRPIPSAPGRGSPPRPARAARPPRRWRAALAVALLAAALVACQGAGVPAPSDAWTEGQLAQVLDLSELGREVTVAPGGGHLLLDGRSLPAEVLERFPHLTMGRSTNLLRFADDALEAMSPEARAFVLRAAPAELRERLGSYGLALADLRAAWGERGVLDLVGLRAVAAGLDRSATGALARPGSAATAGDRLLADLGVAP